MKHTALVTLLLCLSWANSLKAQSVFNGNLENPDNNGNPRGWDLSYHQRNKYEVKLDSIVNMQGKYSVSITSNGETNNGAIVYNIPKVYQGKRLMLIGYLKTENVTEGFAGIWLRVNGAKNKELAFESMENQRLSGTHDWKKYMVSIPYNQQEAVSIEAGALLIGKGKVWVDSLCLYLDERPIDEVPFSKYGNYKALKDTVYDKASKIESIAVNLSSIKQLTALGQLWGFLKYHHPAIARGDYNWDAELFRIIPKLIQNKTDQQVSTLLENWVDQLGPVTKCDTCTKPVNPQNIALSPDYGNLFQQPVFSKTLRAKLQYILKNGNNEIQYYVGPSEKVSLTGFIHENEYADEYYPDAGLRLLALYRYWAVIQYFSPNRELTDKDWNDVLPEYIPKVLQAKNARVYVEAITQLVSDIKDTHGFIRSTIREHLMGKFKVPLQAKFIENQLVVTKYYRDTLDVRKNLHVGDIIIAINGTKITDLIKKYSPMISASNNAATLRDLPSNYLLANADSIFLLDISRGGKALKVSQLGLPRKLVDDAYWQAPAGEGSYKLLSPEIGYVHCGKYKSTELDSIKSRFRNTKGMIIDMRGYPIDDMMSTIAAWCKPDSSAFIKFSKPQYNRPGLFIYSDVTSVGNKQSEQSYHGKVIVIANETTQSNAEFVTMAFQSAPNATVIGSTTSGADGNITSVDLPGGITTWFSGIGVFYPDGTNAQRTGVKIDKVVQPTIEGIRKGIDEVLEEAKRMINSD